MLDLIINLIGNQWIWTSMNYHFGIINDTINQIS